MSEQRFTSGPWAVDAMVGYETALGVGVEGGNTALAVLTRDSNGDAETQLANAHLIAAAPDLLEAAQLALKYFDECVMSCDEPDEDVEEAAKLRAAIKKAEAT